MLPWTGKSGSFFLPVSRMMCSCNAWAPPTVCINTVSGIRNCTKRLRPRSLLILWQVTPWWTMQFQRSEKSTANEAYSLAVLFLPFGGQPGACGFLAEALEKAPVLSEKASLRLLNLVPLRLFRGAQACRQRNHTPPGCPPNGNTFLIIFLKFSEYMDFCVRS